MKKYLIVSNIWGIEWDNILEGCYVNIVEADSPMEAANKGSQSRTYVVGEVHEPYRPYKYEAYPYAISVIDAVHGCNTEPADPKKYSKKNKEYVMGVHKLYADFRMLKPKLYAVGQEVGGLMECPEVNVEGIEIIEARNPFEAADIYNFKYKCDFFMACVAAVIEDGTPTNISRYAKLDDIYKAMDEYGKTHPIKLASDDFAVKGEPDMVPNQTTIKDIPTDAIYRAAAKDMISHMRVNSEGLLGVKCDVDVDGKRVHIFATTDEDIVCVKKSVLQKVIKDLDTV